MLAFLRRRRRAAVRRAPFPPAWRAILDRNVPCFGRLPAEDQEELLGHIQVFLAEKPFEGCGGLEVTDEIRVTVAAQACLLLLHRETDYYPDLEVILVYPSTYVARGREVRDGGVVVEGGRARLGESWSRGAVVLAWDGVLAGAADVSDGHNLVLHEFAHQLDQEEGPADGAPELPERSMYAAWARILGREYERLLRDEASLKRTVIDPYGATNPAEFFAVVTEAFFEKPRKLRAKHPELYDQLKAFYRQDPAGR
ncbi:M90 family metallopeptidase [Sorangium sp. So ce260]|uniref:M90 family metallopeptidase n=1 Tax=Sorangium sp. So ce260 TaxID=3133291 RepID=UPI003F61F5F6